MFALRRSSAQAHSSKKWLFALTNLTLQSLLLTAWASVDVQALNNADLSSESNTTIFGKIVRGKTAPPGRFPYACSLRERGTRRHMCGATLFRRDWVLTAAHCVDPDVRPTVGLSPIVYCGIHDRKKAEEHQVFDAIAGYIHPKWTGDVGRGHDVAVLKLDRDADVTLPRLGTGYVPLEKGRYLGATGWGLTKDGVVAKKLQVAGHLAVVGQDKCKTQPQGVDPTSWICGGGLHEDTCKGDSGGPLLLMDAPYGQVEDGKPRLDMIVGVTSFGYAGDDADACSGDEPAIYTRVDYFLDWIERTINCHQDRSRCVATHQVMLNERRKHYALFSESAMIEEMLRVMRSDNSIDAEALILAGLHVNATYGQKDVQSLPKSDRSTLLHAAAALDAAQCAQILIKYDAGIDIPSANGNTPLHEAAIFNSDQVAKVLMKHDAGIDITRANGYTPLHEAATSNSARVAKILLDHGADTDVFDDRNWTPLHIATYKGHVNIVKYLVGYGADLDVFRDSDGFSPLLDAAAKGFIQIAKILVNGGADVDVFDKRGFTPLHKAANRGSVQIARILIEAGASINTSIDSNWTPLHETAAREHIDLQRILLEHGADIEAMISSERFGTPLHVAASYGKLQSAKVMLVAAGANKKSTNTLNKIPFDRICSYSGAKCTGEAREGLTELLRV